MTSHDSSNFDSSVIEVDMQDGSEIDISKDKRGCNFEAGIDGGEVTGVLEKDDSDEDSAPIVVPTEEVSASLARSSIYIDTLYPRSQEEQQHSLEFPLLFAALCPGEDILMACARILDDKVDVSLVREAAAYLRLVEARKQCD